MNHFKIVCLILLIIFALIVGFKSVVPTVNAAGLEIGKYQVSCVWNGKSTECYRVDTTNGVLVKVK